MKYTAQEVLEAREERVKKQEALLKRFEIPLLVMRVNYPGLEKDNLLTQNIIESLGDIVCDIFKYSIVCKIIRFTAEGPLLMVSLSGDAKKIKSIAIDIEDKHILGRCVDIDVYDVDGNCISRTTMGTPMRTCFLCDDIAHHCIRTHKHSEDEIVSYIKDRYREYMESFYGKKV